MCYNLTVSTKEKSIQYKIQELKEMLEILKQYQNELIEVELHKEK